ncbi:hypothetical protein HK405_006344, partial [Cladochytrium tenue]
MSQERSPLKSVIPTDRQFSGDDLGPDFRAHRLSAFSGESPFREPLIDSDGRSGRLSASSTFSAGVAEVAAAAAAHTAATTFAAATTTEDTAEAAAAADAAESTLNDFTALDDFLTMTEFSPGGPAAVVTAGATPGLAKQPSPLLREPCWSPASSRSSSGACGGGGDGGVGDGEAQGAGAAPRGRGPDSGRAGGGGTSEHSASDDVMGAET